MLTRLLLTAVLALAGPVGAVAQAQVDTARRLVERYHEEPRRIDQARDLLEGLLERERPVEAMVLLARVYFLYGDVRATTSDEKLVTYERGREWGRRAVELAPKSEEAHVWYAINTGRWGETKGVLRSLFLLPTIHEELDIIFGLNPKSIRGHALAGNVFFKVPRLFGGDRKKAEEHFTKGVEIDPHYTAIRIDFARFLIDEGRYDEARQQLRRVIDERAPNDIAGWTLKDLPRARELLESIKDQK